MNDLLACELTKRGGIRQGTKIEGRYKGNDISGCPLASSVDVFTVKNAKMTKTGKVIFEASDPQGNTRSIHAVAVQAIDGMDPERVAEMHGFTIQGNAIVPAKKRQKAPENIDDDGDDE